MAHIGHMTQWARNPSPGYYKCWPGWGGLSMGEIDVPTNFFPDLVRREKHLVRGVDPRILVGGRMY